MMGSHEVDAPGAPPRNLFIVTAIRAQMDSCAERSLIAAANPTKEMIRICSIRCPHMNEITLEQTLAALEQDRYPVDVPEPTRTRAARSIERMLAIS